MFKVERAIIMAAGFGSRLEHLTKHTPKPLIEIHGISFIENIIQNLLKNEITEIYVVIGYKKEKFEQLKIKYPFIHFIENPYYEKANNISSLYVARNYIDNAIILDGDQYIHNENILNPYFMKSCYAAAWTDKYSKEWVLKVADNKIISCARNGDERGWILYSISFWNKTDGAKLRYFIEKEFIENKNIDIYWDDVPIFLHSEHFNLGIRKINQSDITEVDSLENLAFLKEKVIGNA